MAGVHGSAIDVVAEHAATTPRTACQVDAGEREEALLPRWLCWPRWARVAALALGLKAAAGENEFGAEIAAGQQAVVADLDEAVGQNVEQEAADEFLRGHGDAFAVLGTKADAVFVERDQPVIREAHAMRVPPEIPEDLLRTGERVLRVHHPVLAVEGVLQPTEDAAVGRSARPAHAPPAKVSVNGFCGSRPSTRRYSAAPRTRHPSHRRSGSRGPRPESGRAR